MKTVYVVEQIDAEQWESYHDGIHAIFATKEAALEYIENHEPDDDYILMEPREFVVRGV